MSWHAGTAFDPPSAGAQQTSPSSSTSPNDDAGRRKRKRSDNGDNGDDGGSAGSPTATNKQKHAPGVKRACNDCRQQKLRCNVVAGPGDYYKACDRCIKHNLHCSIDNDFKRLGKRAAHDEMVKELEICRAKLARYESMGIQLPSGQDHSDFAGSYDSSSNLAAPVAPMTGVGGAFLGPNEAAASKSLLDLSQGYREVPPTAYPSITPGTSTTTLGSVTLTEVQLQELYSIFFTSYHPFLPVLNPENSYQDFYKDHPLLHWTIVAIAARRYDAKPGLFMQLQHPLEEILWTTLSQVPQQYHVCKALALLCAWPLPTSSTSHEPTMMLAGVMFQLSMQYGLHRPSHAQDFSRFRIDLREEDIADRLNTWAAVNIVAQNISTGNGQPPLSRWAWFTYGLHLDRMKPALRTRCQIEKYCDTVTRSLFTMQRDHVVEVDYAQRGLTIDMYARELNELEVTILSTDPSPVEIISLKAAALHLRLTAFFDKPSQPNYYADLRNVYIAASALLTHLIALSPDQFLYVPRYVEQMMLAGAITLLKILSSFYANHVDTVQGRTLFSRTVNGLRTLSVRSNDLPQRLAEVTAQLWASSGAAEQRLFKDEGTTRQPDESLQLKVRCRSSLSVLFDAIWRWRERVGQNGRENLADAVQNPTAVIGASGRNTPQPPHPANHSHSLAAGGAGSTLGLPPSHGLSGLDAGGAGELDPLAWDSPFGGNAVFDPLSWALDGNLGLGVSGNPVFTGVEGGVLGGFP